MKAKLTGYRALDFKSDGETVKGLQLFFTYVTPEVVGQCADKVFIRSDQKDLLLIDPSQFLDQVVEMEFDRKGHLLSVSG